LRLTELLEGQAAASNPEIAGLADDSRQVRHGFLFAALAGSRTDGARFIADAVRQGAAAVLAAPGTHVPPPAVLVADAEPRLGLARIAARFFGEQPRTIVAVTGTSGKTSVAEFARQLWTALGQRAASLGTLGIKGPDKSEPLAHTTPDPITLHRALADLRRRGVDHVALEASSHGLDQRRLDAVRVTAAAFTNLSRDHMDYHANADDYAAAKLRLFTAVLPAGGAAIINADSDRADAFAAAAGQRGQRVLTYGRKGRDFRLLDVRAHARGLAVNAEILGRRRQIELPLAGAFQAGNALCALALVMASGSPAEAAVAALDKLAGVPGRMQLAAVTADGAPVYVDYAHKPEALATVLTELRPHVDRRLVVVFGCGGDRDRGKRPLMGEIAQRLADQVFVTDDNPRGEDAAAIRAAIMAACPAATEIGDRRAAIGRAVAGLCKGDVLVVAGKGHEQGQIVGATVLPFDDTAAAREAVAAAQHEREAC
jgi:UDP-N-acetylmuramoyl-L-alanyl-D-glutamate--2,6-diaminopimelate ligase